MDKLNREPHNVENNLLSLKTPEFEKFLRLFDSTHGDDNVLEHVPGDAVSGEKFPLYETQEFISSSNNFLRISSVDNGGLYLQHYIAALYKALSPIEMNGFRILLKTLFKLETTPDPTVLRTIENCHDHTFHCYNDTFDIMLNVLGYTHVVGCSSVQESIEAKVNKVMSDYLDVSSTDMWWKQFGKEPNQLKKREKRDTALNVYTYAMSRSKYLIHYNNMWYAYTNEGAYKTVSVPSLPFIYMWVNFDDSVKRYFENKVSFFTETNMWSNGHFMFATSVGVFNSLSGLYSAKTPLLRFSKHRNYAVWEPEKPLVMYNEQNEDVLVNFESSKRFSDAVFDRITDLFLHYQIIPAIMQLPQVYDIDQLQMIKFFELFEHHANLESAYFLVEYFPVNPKFVYLIMSLYSDYDIGTITSYENLSNSVFGYKSYVTSDDWSVKFRNIIDDGVCVSNGAGSRMEQLMSMHVSDRPFDEFSKDLCLISVLVSLCMIRCIPFGPLRQAFGMDNTIHANETSEHIPPRYRGIRYETTRDSYKMILEHTLTSVFGDDMTPFERSMATMIVQLGMSACFDPQTTAELVNMVSAVYVPRNVLKKMMIFFGPKDTGKSFLCDLIQELNAPCVGRFQDMRSAVERSNITTKVNVTIINEAKQINPDHMKSVTGNDPESAQVFYSQHYEMQKSQSLIYGATNNVIRFSDGKKPFNVDRTTVERIHAITLRGKQVSFSDMALRKDSIFSMVASSNFFTDIINSPLETSARVLGWITFASYYLRRDENFRPTINTTNRDVLVYQHRVYYENSSLYKILVRSGLKEESGFFMDKRSFLTTVMESINKSKGSCKTTSMSFSDFEELFNSHYSVELKKIKHVWDLQHADAIDHIKRNMATVESEGSHISAEELEVRVKSYSAPIIQANAREFFKRRNLRYDPENARFLNVRFVLDKTSCYEGNEIRRSGASYTVQRLDEDVRYNALQRLLQPSSFVTDSF